MTQYDQLIQQHLWQGWRIESQCVFGTAMVKRPPLLEWSISKGLTGALRGDMPNRILIETDGYGRGRVKVVA